MTTFQNAVSIWGKRGVNIAKHPDIGVVDAFFRIVLGVGCLWFGSKILAAESLDERPQMLYVKLGSTVLLVGFFLCPSFRATLEFLWQIRTHPAGLVIFWRIADRIGSAVSPYFQ